ncbi:hypothetical protein GW7_12206 [Heterocephalus glaber]|uniref:Uncharacterized protein n=1 Tax=Heterocephalus glaber TaxID=10181 RepID=G5C5D2_HETGA|nr:hypothetical protein GW7_12206 [Heterocephalus glaber]
MMQTPDWTPMMTVCRGLAHLRADFLSALHCFSSRHANQRYSVCVSQTLVLALSTHQSVQEAGKEDGLVDLTFGQGWRGTAFPVARGDGAPGRVAEKCGGNGSEERKRSRGTCGRTSSEVCQSLLCSHADLGPHCPLSFPTRTHYQGPKGFLTFACGNGLQESRFPGNGILQGSKLTVDSLWGRRREVCRLSAQGGTPPFWVQLVDTAATGAKKWTHRMQRAPYEMSGEGSKRDVL